MDVGEWERMGALYVPVVAALALGLPGGRRERMFPACLLSLLWTVPSLVALQLLNVRFGWWSFAGGSAAELRGMPLELLLGWALLWGIVPQFCLPWLGIWATGAGFVALDLVAMPLLRSSVRLGPDWLVGEAVAVAAVLLPALCVGEWTRRDAHLRLRVGLQVATAGALFLFLLPEIVFASRLGAGWEPLLAMASWERQLWLLAIFGLAVPGVSAAMEFAGRGGGTPIPYDPPRRLVVSGVYRYVANPMQMACTLTMAAWAGVLRNGWLLVAAGISLVYSAGIAAWDEKDDLLARFGEDWVRYRAEVRDWRPRPRPYCSGPEAVVYIARGCGPCSAVRRWIEARSPVGLRIVDAETLPAGSIRRMTYDAGDGSAPVDGVRAMARAMEHLHVGWAWCGAAGRLPGVWWAVQTVLDACGLGPREVCGLPAPSAADDLG